MDKIDYLAPEPPKQRVKGGSVIKTMLGVALGIMLFLVVVAGCTAAMLGSGSDGTSSGSVTAVDSSSADDAGTTANEDKPAAEDSTRGDQDHPVRIHQGKAFDIRGFSYHAGWSIHRDVFGLGEIRGLKVTNHRSRTDSALVDVKLWRGSEVLIDISCTSDPIARGTTVTLDCSSADDLPSRWTKATMQDTF